MFTILYARREEWRSVGAFLRYFIKKRRINNEKGSCIIFDGMYAGSNIGWMWCKR